MIQRYLAQVQGRIPKPVRRYWFEYAALLVAIGVVVAAICAGGVSLNFNANPGESDAQDSSGRSDAENFRNLVLLVVGASALPFAVWRSRSGERQADGTAKQAESAARQAEDTRLTRLNDQFTAAAQMVGHEAAAVRRLGIHSVQALATDHPAEYYVRVLRSLCDYAREPFLRADGVPDAADPSPTRLRSDVQAAVQAIGKVWQLDVDTRNAGLKAEPRYVPNLIEADLQQGRFWSFSLEGAHLERAICEKAVFGNVNLDEVDFTRAKLTDADLTGRSIDDRESIRGCSLRDAVLKNTCCEGTDFGDTDLSGANFDGAIISGADFSGKPNDKRSVQVRSARGLTQAQLDQACADPDRRPRLDGMVDPETKEPLTWRGRPLDSDPA